MKVYCTKYALTRGILTFEGEVVESGQAYNTLRYFSPKDPQADLLKDSEWYFWWSDAHDRAGDLRAREVGRLKAQITHLESIKFTRPEDLVENTPSPENPPQRHRMDETHEKEYREGFAKGVEECEVAYTKGHRDGEEFAVSCIQARAKLAHATTAEILLDIVREIRCEEWGGK